nr:NS1 [Big Cypress virus]
MDLLSKIIPYYPIAGEEKCAVTLISILGQHMRCSHRDGKCRVKGKCVVKYLDEVLIDIKDDHSGSGGWHDDIKKVIDICQRAVLSGPDVWCAIMNASTHKTYAELADEFTFASKELLNAYKKCGMPEGEPWNWKMSRKYLDDSTSLCHLFYVPHNGREAATPIGSLRLCKFLILVYADDFDVRGGIYQWDPSFKKTNQQYLGWGVKTYPDTHDSGVLKWTVWMKASWRRELVEQSDGCNIQARLEMEEKFIEKLRTREATRFFFQKFGVQGDCVEDMTAILMNTYDGHRSVYSMSVNRQNCGVLSYAIPMLLVRTSLLTGLGAEELTGYFIGSHTCQLCYLNLIGGTGAMTIDTRAYELLGREPKRVLRPLRHVGDCKCGMLGSDAECVCGLDGLDLRHGEMISRQGNHWVAVTCENSDDALLVTATLIHRFYRGGGPETEIIRRVALAAVSRCFLYWCCAGNQLQAIFKMLAYLYIKHDPDMHGRMNFLELGSFLRYIMTPQHLSFLNKDRIVEIVTQFATYFIQLERKGKSIYTPNIPMPQLLFVSGKYQVQTDASFMF